MEEARIIEDDGTLTDITAAELESGWTAVERAAMQFQCVGCEIRVHPWAMESRLRTAHFSARTQHDVDCGVDGPAVPGDGDATDRAHTEDPVQNGPPILNTLRVVATRPRVDIADEPVGNRDRAVRSRGTVPAPRTPGGMSGSTVLLGRICEQFLAMAPEDRVSKPLSIPGVEAHNFRYAFRRLRPQHEPIGPMPRRVFYAELRWRETATVTGDTATIALHAGRLVDGRIAHPCTLIVDRTGWTPGQVRVHDRLLETIRRQGRELSIDRNDPRKAWIFFLGDQSAADATQFTVRDRRHLYTTAAIIRHATK